MSTIDYLPSSANEPQVRKCRVLGDWGKIMISCVVRKSCCSEQKDSEMKGLLQVKARPCWVSLKKCSITSPLGGLVWNSEKKVNLEDKAVEIIYNGVVIGDVEVNTDKGNKQVKSFGMLGMPSNPKKRKSVGKLHSCIKCGKTLKTMDAYRSHVLSHYQIFQEILPNTKPYTCPVCFKSFNRKYQQISHYALGHNKVFELTDLTRETLKLPNNVNNVGREEDGRFSCPKCGFKFIKRHYVQSHMLTHYHDVFHDVLPHKKPFNCPICGKMHMSWRALIRHYAFTHKKVFELTDSSPAEWFIVRVENNEDEEVCEDEEVRLNELLSPCPSPGSGTREDENVK